MALHVKIAVILSIAFVFSPFPEWFRGKIPNKKNKLCQVYSSYAFLYGRKLNKTTVKAQ